MSWWDALRRRFGRKPPIVVRPLVDPHAGELAALRRRHRAVMAKKAAVVDYFREFDAILRERTTDERG
jgi:hypothetical protein